MPTVPQRSYPEFDAPSETHLQMAAEAVAKRFEPSNEGLTPEQLEATNVKTLSGMRAFVDPERFHKAWQGWPESANVEGPEKVQAGHDRLTQKQINLLVETSDRAKRTPSFGGNALKQLEWLSKNWADPPRGADVKDPIGSMIKKLDIREYPVTDAEIQKIMRKQRDKLR